MTIETKTKSASMQEREDAMKEGAQSTQAATLEPDKHSAELNGDKVIVRHDLVQQRLAQSQGSHLALTDKQGQPSWRAFPEWYFCWADENDMPVRLRDGFDIVNPKTMPELVAPGQSDYDKKDQPNKIKVRELTLMRLPMVEHIEYVKLHDQTVNMVNEAQLDERADGYLRNETGGIIQGAASSSRGASIQRG